MYIYKLTTGISKVKGQLSVFIKVVDNKSGGKRGCVVTPDGIHPITKNNILDYEPNDICENNISLNFDIFKMNDIELGLYSYWLAAYELQQTIHIPNSPRRLDERGVYIWRSYFEIAYCMRLDKNNKPVFNNI